MKQIYLTMFCLIALCAYAYRDAKKNGQHLVVPDPFTIAISLSHTNDLGDSALICQTQYCQETDYFVGAQTHFLYAGKTNAMAGLPVSRRKMTRALVKEILG